MKKIFITLLCAILSSTMVYAQNGKVKGVVFDAANGEPLFGVAVSVQGTTSGAITDFDGKFEILVTPGVYTFELSFISFRKVVVSDVNVLADETTMLGEISMEEDVETLDAVLVTAEVIRNSESALMTVKRKSPAVMDGISATNFAKIGDSDAASAAKRVTGVSVEGGKYIYVRGLGDRYTKTTLNGIDIPGLDPDKNTIQMDIFPTNLINNMMVAKTFLPEYPADFTGGLINIETKDFPDEKLLNVSFGMSFNPSMHFNSDYIDYEGSSTDFLGFDNGSRALPDGARSESIPSPISGHSEEEVSSFLRSFDSQLGARTSTSFMDYNLGVSYADIKHVRGNELGVILSLSYKSTTRFYDEFAYGDFQKKIDASENELVYATTQEGTRGEKGVLIGGIAGLAYKTDNSRYKLSFMQLQSGESSATQLYIDNNGANAVGQSGYTAIGDGLTYEQRGVTNVLLNGEHNNDDGSWNIDWRASLTNSNIVEPDIRKAAFSYQNDGDLMFSAGDGGLPTRIWRSLDEINAVGKVDLTKEYQVFANDAKLKFGVNHVYKQRDYEILIYNLQFFGSQADFGGDLNNVLLGENIYSTGSVYYSSGFSDPNPNAYNANSGTSSFYVSTEVSPTEKLKLIAGVRGEQFSLKHTGRDQEAATSNGSQGNILDNTKVLDSFDLFPSLNSIYSLTETQNLRLSYSKTIARPSFKELSYAQILDPVSDRIFIGGLAEYEDWDGNLTETRINNFDLRWEMYLQSDQLFSVSAFYKTFDDAIELVRIRQNVTSNEFQPRNVGDAAVLGAEFEFRKKLDFITPVFTGFSLNGNLTLVKSQLEMSESEYESRLETQRDGETIENTRAMVGQSPYIVNAGLGYDNQRLGLDAGLFYNVKGATLYIVGGGIFPDVYTEPFSSLNFNLNKRFGEEGNSKINVSVDNILNSRKHLDYRSFEAENQTFETMNPGISISVGYSLSF